MAARRTRRNETVSTPFALLATLRDGRRAMNTARGTVRISGETYLRLGHVVEAIDALALHLTGNVEHFWDEWHRTP